MTGITIPKSSGGVRKLAIGAVPDRIVERAVLTVLDPLVDPVLSPWSFAFRKGLGVKDAARALVAARDAGAAWVARTDVDDCFVSIPRWPVLERLRELVSDVEVVGLVESLIGRPVVRDEKKRRDDVSLFLSGYGPRVQLSVFEVELANVEAAAEFRKRLRSLIDPDDDQVRLYRLTRDALAQRLIYGNRTLEERVDFWIV